MNIALSVVATVVFLNQYCAGSKIETNEMGRARGTLWGRIEVCAG